jgi:hypothetical protein
MVNEETVPGLRLIASMLALREIREVGSGVRAVKLRFFHRWVGRQRNDRLAPPSGSDATCVASPPCLVASIGALTGGDGTFDMTSSDLRTLSRWLVRADTVGVDVWCLRSADVIDRSARPLRQSTDLFSVDRGSPPCRTGPPIRSSAYRDNHDGCERLRNASSQAGEGIVRRHPVIDLPLRPAPQGFEDERVPCPQCRGGDTVVIGRIGLRLVFQCNAKRCRARFFRSGRPRHRAPAWVGGWP